MRQKLAVGISILAMHTAFVATSARAEVADSAAPPAPKSASTDSGGTGDIIVTAQRRSQRLQDVPISVSAFSGDQLTARGAITSNDIGQLTTGVIIAEVDSSVIPYIRGIGSDTIVLGEAGSVATYVDGVYMPDPTGAIYDLANLESVEVLKGPQGTLFGRNTAGGAINIRTQAPKFTPGGNFEASYGNFNAVSIRGYATGPINDKIAFSIAGNYSYKHNYINDLVRGGKIDPARRSSVRGTLLIKPTERLSVTLTGDYTHSSDPAPVAVSAISGYFGETPTSLAPKTLFDYIGSIKPEQHISQGGVSANIVYDFGGATLTSLSAFRAERINEAIEVDRTPVDYVDLPVNSRTRVFSQEVQLASKAEGPFTWLLGGYFAHQKSQYDPLILVGSQAGPGGRTEIDITAQTDIYAVFANATYKLGNFELTGGLRYNKDHKQYIGSVNGFPVITKGQAKHTWNSVTPRFVLSYHPSRNLLVYASYSQGFKSGAFNTISFPTEPIDPETVKAYELGAKISPSRAITINSALFLYDRKNVQVQSQDPVTGLGTLQNAAASRSKGAEVEITARPFRGLSLHAGVTYLDAKYTKFTDAQVYVPIPVPAGGIPGSLGNAALSEDVSGEAVERSPKWTYNLSGSYDFQLGNGSTVTPSVNVFRTTRYFYNRGNRLLQPAYTLLNAEIAWKMSNGITLAAWGKNLTNKVYLRNYVTNQFADSAIAAEPRTYGVRASYRF